MQQPDQTQVKTKKKQIWKSVRDNIVYIAAGIFLLATIVVSIMFSHSRIKQTEYDILNKQREITHAWVDITLSNVNEWHKQILEQIYNVSRAETFRLFAVDLRDLPQDALDALVRGQVEKNEEHDLNAMSEEHAYLTGLLNDLAKRQGWLSAQILRSDKAVLIPSIESSPLSAEHQRMLENVAENHKIMFSAVYEQDNVLIIDAVAPLQELSMSVDKSSAVVGFLCLSMPVDNFIKKFLSESKAIDPSYKASFITKGDREWVVVQMQEGKTAIVATHDNEHGGVPLSFMQRQAVTEDKQVWSQGARLTDSEWYIVLEKPANLIEKEIKDYAYIVYGFCVSGDLALLFLFIIIVVEVARIRHATQESRRCIEGLIHAMESALDDATSKQKYFQGRSRRLEKLAEQLGKRMKFSSAKMDNVRLAARLSQVGKIFVPRDLMIKRGLLTNEERRLVQLAPYHAYNILKGLVSKRMAQIVYEMGGREIDNPETGENHELVAKEMLPEARVLFVANNFCAMIAQRGTRPPLPMSVARQKMAENENIYDKEVVATLNTFSDIELEQILADADAES